MLRIHKIEEHVKKHSEALTLDEVLKENAGVSANQLGEAMDLIRSNVSADLNALFKDGKLIKIKGKPIRYLDKRSIEKKLDVHLPNICECYSLNELLPAQAQRTEVTDPFQSLIGCRDSLLPFIDVAKASVLYPPRGLHSILVGESGTGKSLFAETMYQYGIKERVFAKDSSFIVFNCADYASNSHLLLSQLFGHKKGAFTGANEDKVGLVEMADGGVFFLDEVHRLPPEGQEMLFLLIDRKMFRRLGESKGDRRADVLIIAATTENPESSLLTTFVRRIPMVISLPSLRERSLAEKINIVGSFYGAEAEKINHPITVTSKSIINLVTYNPKGNLGQLRSDIQLSTARAYLQAKLDKRSSVIVEEEYLPAYTKNGILQLVSEQKRELELLLPEDEFLFQIGQKAFRYEGASSRELIQFFDQKLRGQKEITAEMVRDFFEEYTNNLSVNMLIHDIDPLFIDEETKEMVTYVFDILLQEINYSADRSVYLALAFYLKNLREYGGDQPAVKKYTTFHQVDKEIYDLSKKIMFLLEKEYSFYFPVGELDTFAVILSSLKNRQTDEQPVGIMVVSHGNTLATNIAYVVNELLASEYVMAIDMPLNETLETTMERMVELLRVKCESRDLIIFADMGSLSELDDILKQRTGIEAVTVESNHVLLVLEAARKALVQKKNKRDILEDLIAINQRLNVSFQKKIERYLSLNRTRVIYTVCTTGEETAYYLEKAVKNLLSQHGIDSVDVLPLSLKKGQNGKRMLLRLSENKEIVAVVGSIDLEIEQTEFVSLEEILLGEGTNRILGLLGVKKEEYKPMAVRNLTRDLVLSIVSEKVNQYLTYLSADKMIWMIREFIHTVESELEIILHNGAIIRLFTHMCYMIERSVFKGGTMTAQEELGAYRQRYSHIYKVIEPALSRLEEVTNSKFQPDELYYLTEIIKDNQ